MEISGISSVEADTAMLAAPLSSANRYFAECPLNDKLDRTRSPRFHVARHRAPGREEELPRSAPAPTRQSTAAPGVKTKSGIAEPRLERDVHFHTRQVERMQRWGKSPPPELSIRRG
jgi:hypothetical protein